MIVSSRVGPSAVEPEAVAADDSASVFSTPFMVVDEFLDRREAAVLRGQVDDHFAEPHKHQPATHQVWNYWHVPGLYTYLRTMPEKVIDHDLVTRFHQALSLWAARYLGLGHVTWPYLSLYVDGCQQSLHNDSTNGRLGYVYSLTWDDRQTTGGETIVLREGDLFRGNMTRAAAGIGLLDLIEPRFNRLALFDDRMPHGVQRVEGSMNPVEGRFVLHGHISESGPAAQGGLTAEEVGQAVAAKIAGDIEALGSALFHGPLVLRLEIAASGEVRDLDRLVDRVARIDGGSAAPEVGRLLSAVRALRFRPAGAVTVATVPLMIGGELPWMRAS